jgi:hypothetical protein
VNFDAIGYRIATPTFNKSSVSSLQDLLKEGTPSTVLNQSLNRQHILLIEDTLSLKTQLQIITILSSSIEHTIHMDLGGIQSDVSTNKPLSPY